MTTVDERSTRTQRLSVYVVVGLVLGGLLLAGYLRLHAVRSLAGAICADPDAAVVSGAGPASRPVLSPESVVRAQRLVIEAHCPGKLR